MAFGRIGEIFRAWEQQLTATAATPDADVAAISRLVTRQLDYWQQADARLKAFLATHAVEPRLAAQVRPQALAKLPSRPSPWFGESRPPAAGSLGLGGGVGVAGTH